MEVTWMVFTVVLGGLLAFFGIMKSVNEWIYVRRLGKKRDFLPLGDMGWPFIGTQLSFVKAFMSNDPDSFISKFVARYGPKGIYRAMMFGKPCVIVTTPESCKKVLLDDDTFKLRYPESVAKIFGERLFDEISKDDHKRMRRLAAGALSGQEALSSYLFHMERIATGFFEEWATISLSRPIEFLTETRKFAFRVIMNVMMGDSSTARDFMEATEKEYDVVFRGFFAMPIDLPGFAFHNALKARKKLQTILEAVVDQRQKESGVKKQGVNKDMLDMFMEVEDENGGKLSDLKIVDLVATFLVAGHESSSNTAAWAVVLLQQHPEVFQKAKEEQQNIVSKRPPDQKGLTLEEIRQMEYLSKVIDETMRVVNFSLAVFREATTDANVNGCLVPKGWMVLVWLRSAHLDPDKFLNPKEFNPSRWDDPNTRAYSMPFGAGCRICPGRDLAKLKVYVFVHCFLLNYKLERVNPDCPVKYLPTPRLADNCLARIIRVP